MEQKRIKAIILLVSSLMMLSFCLAAIVAEVARAYPAVDTSRVQLLLTLPAVVSIPVTLLSGWLQKRFPIKSLLLFAMGMALLGGLIPLIFRSAFWPLLLGCALFGFEKGLLTPLTAALIVRCFDGRDKSRMMGAQAIVVGVGMAAFSTLAGVIGNVSWRSVYWLFLVYAPVIVLTCLWLPKEPPAAAAPVCAPAEAPRSARVRSITGMAVFLSVTMLLFRLLNQTFNIHIALYLEQLRLGGALESGISTTMFALGSILAGVLVGAFPQKQDRLLYPLAAAALLGGFLCVAFGSSLIFMLLGGLLIGVGTSVMLAFGLYRVPASYRGAAFGAGLALLATGNTVGSAIAGTVMGALTRWLGLPEQSGAFLLSVVIAGVCLLVGAGFSWWERKHGAAGMRQELSEP